jgi:hypothetical protein
MSIDMKRRGRPGRWRVFTAFAMVVAMAGCGLDEVNVPDLGGPSTYGVSLLLTVNKDVLVADGGDFAVVTATVREPDGRPAANRDVFFAIADESGVFADIGVIVGQNGPGTGATVRTNTQGISQILYEAPPRTDATANQTVLVMARVVGNDFNGMSYRSVRIELRSAQPRIFPPTPGNQAPKCSFIVEPAFNPFFVGQVIGFHSTSSDSDGVIIRYEWDFGTFPPTQGDSPDVAFVYRTPGTYTVTHIVTDDDGAQSAPCTAQIVVLAR